MNGPLRHLVERWVSSWPLVLLAALFTLLNSFKPLHVDDTTFYFNAVQVAKHPLDPYGFALMCYDAPRPANQALAPPLLPYWWAAAIRLFGMQPFYWKLWLFPFSLIFVVSLHALFRRFAGGLETPLTWMTVLSPAFLPSLNLMMDIPALALSLLALELFFRAGDRDSMGMALAAGLVTGLALETKYTAFLTPVILLAYALLFRRLRLWLILAGMAGLVLIAWESAMAQAYGEAHFIHHLIHHPRASKLDLALPLLILLGSIGPAVALLGMIGLSFRSMWVIGTGLVVGLAYSRLPFDPTAEVVIDISIRFFRKGFTVTDVIFAILGVWVLVMAAWAGWPSSRKPEGRQPANTERRWSRFLLLWFVLEFGGYFALSPNPAVRRIMGLVVAGTILTGRLAARSAPSPPRVGLVWAVAAGNMLLGFGLAGLDWREAVAEQEAAEVAAQRIRELGGGGTVWYVGYWGFQFYAERAGMSQVIPWYEPGDNYIALPPSVLEPGDWLVMPDRRIIQQHVALEKNKTDLVDQIEVKDGLPLRTVPGFYGGAKPIIYDADPRIVVRIFRVRSRWVCGNANRVQLGR